MLNYKRQFFCFVLVILSAGCASTSTHPNEASTIDVLLDPSGRLQGTLDQKQQELDALTLHVNALSDQLALKQEALTALNNRLAIEVERGKISDAEVDKLTQEIQERGNRLMSTRTRLNSLQEKLNSLKFARQVSRTNPTTDPGIAQTQNELKHLEDEVKMLEKARAITITNEQTRDSN